MPAFGSTINPALGRVDYSPISQGMGIAAQNIAEGGAALAQGMSEGVKNFMAKQEERKQTEAATSMIGNILKTNPGFAKSLGIPVDMSGAPDQKALAAAIKAVGAPNVLAFATKMQEFDAQQKLIAQQTEAERLRQDAFRQEMAIRQRQEDNMRALTAAYAKANNLAGGTRVERSVTKTYATPTSSLGDFLYGTKGNVEKEAVVRVPSSITNWVKDDGKLDENRIVQFRNDYVNDANRIQNTLAALRTQRNTLESTKSVANIGAVDLGVPIANRGGSVKKIDAEIKRQEGELESLNEYARGKFSALEDYRQGKPTFEDAVKAMPASKLLSAAVKVVEKTVPVSATSEQKKEALIKEYLNKGGTIDDNFLKQANSAFKEEYKIIDVGDMKFLSINGQTLPVNKPAARSVSGEKKDESQAYEEMKVRWAATGTPWHLLPEQVRMTFLEFGNMYERGKDETGLGALTPQQAYERAQAQFMAKGPSQSGSGGTAGAQTPKPAIPAGQPAGWVVRGQ